MSGEVPTREGEDTESTTQTGQETTFSSSRFPAGLQRGALAYTIVCLCALLFLYQVLEDGGAGDWSFFPVVVGSAGAFLRWGMAPLFLLASIALTLLVEANRSAFQSSATFRVQDLLLCGTVLAYAMAHYRMTLIHGPFPVEGAPSKKKETSNALATAHSELETASRGRQPSKDGPHLPTSSASKAFLPWRADETGSVHEMMARDQPESPFISSSELGFLLLSLPIWAGLAQLAWHVLPQTWENPGIAGPVWRVLLYVWLAGGLALVTASVLDYWQRRSMTQEEARAFLQDTLWRETRGEQRRINRWYAWARVRNRHPSFWQEAHANRRVLFAILIVDLLLVLFVLVRLIE